MFLRDNINIQNHIKIKVYTKSKGYNKILTINQTCEHRFFLSTYITTESSSNKFSRKDKVLL